MSEERASYGGSLAFSVASFMSMGVIGLGSSVVLARLYGVTVIGQYALVLTVAAFCLMFSTIREQTALVKDLAVLKHRDPSATGRFYAVLLFSVAFSVVVGGAAFLISTSLFRGPVDQPTLVRAVAIIILGHIFLEKVGWNIDLTLTAYRAARELFWVRLFQILIFVGVAVALGMGDRDTVMSLVAATVVSWAFGLAARVLLLRRFVRLRVSAVELRNGFRHLPGYLRFGLKAGGASFGSVAAIVPTWVLGIVGNITAVGAYSRAEMITTRMVEGIWRVTEMLFPTLVERRKNGDIAGFDRSLIDTLRYMAVALLAFGGAIGGAAIGVMQFFGPGFDQAAGALALLMVLPVLYGMISGLQLALYSVDRPGRVSVVEIVRLAATVVATAGLGILYGATGVAAGVLIVAGMSVVIYGVLMHPHLEDSFTAYWPWREIFALAAAYAGSFGLARVIDLSSPGIGGTIVAVFAGFAAYAVIFWLLGGLNSRDRDRLSRVRGSRLHRSRVAQS